MTRNDLYAATFRYKKTGLWKKLRNTEMFAIRLSNGEYGYISIMGHAGDFCSVGLYIGDEGFDSFRILVSTDIRGLDEFKEHEIFLHQKCLQLLLTNKEDLTTEDVDETRAYAKANGIRLGGKNAFPRFIKYEPGYSPWKVNKTADIDAFYQAIEVCALLGETLKTAVADDFGIVAIHPHTTQVPLLKVVDGCLKQDGYAPLPSEKERIYETVPFKNDIGAARVKKLPKAKTWETEVIRTMNPVQESPDETPYYPLLLLVVESRDGFVLPDIIQAKDEQSMGDMLDALVQALVNQGSAPREFRCRDSCTYALLADFCERTGIRLRHFSGKMEMLDDAKYAILDYFVAADFPNELTQMTEILLCLPDEVIQTMPQTIYDGFRNLLDENILPDELAQLLKAKLGL